jgi:hypothetical protein
MSNVNFGALWTRLMTMATKAEDDRMKSTLMNHENQKERICRRLGVVSEADVRRIEASFRRRDP